MLEYVLELSNLPEEPLHACVSRARHLGYTFATLKTLAEKVECVYWLHQECRKRQPPLETHQEPQDYALWITTWASDTARPDLYHVLVCGRELVGVSGLTSTETAGEFICGFTGILASHASRGLALALKSHLLLTAREEGVQRVLTRVHSNNHGMLQLNHRLGFVPVQAPILNE